ncbi:hypothetical protein PVAP13_2NG060900 [Panicum virgatum]|uniref:Uncharacterized protein n=1 Tax=Panicum virgatum TaxID=38727 RepID=A0A8T0VCF6_PANVG|nr:hypothetical protein PVAP13_2NG060900 [Panicum virgatum]
MLHNRSPKKKECTEKTEPISMVTLQGRCSPCGLYCSNHYDHLLSVTATQDTAEEPPGTGRALQRTSPSASASPATWRATWTAPCCRPGAWSSPGDLAMALADELHCRSPSR